MGGSQRSDATAAPCAHMSDVYFLNFNFSHIAMYGSLYLWIFIAISPVTQNLILKFFFYVDSCC